MANRLRKAFLGELWSALLTGVLILVAGPLNAAVIAPGAMTTTVPASLDDPFGTLISPLPAGRFLLPVEIIGANDLQLWSFDLLFDANVVSPLDVGGLSQSVYASAFNGIDPSLSSILSSGALGAGGLIGIGGFSSGVSGDGTLAYVLFEYLPNRPTNDPGFGIRDTPGQQVPEPGTIILLAAALLTLSLLQRARGGRRGTMPR